MSALFRFVDVRCGDSGRAWSFTLHSGDTRLLQLASRAEKEALIDLAIGESVCREGVIEIVKGGRRHHSMAVGPLAERRHDDDAAPTRWQPLSASRPGRVGWVAANGGLISNLKIWENVSLPHWYHARREAAETEQSIVHWLGLLGLEQDRFAEFMAALPYSVEPWQRKLAGLLRALVQMPRVLVVDADVLDGVSAHLARSWIAAMEAYAAQGHAILVLADKATALSWEKFE